MSKVNMPPYQWQSGAWQKFVRQVDSSMLPHAILVSGCPGIGVEKLAATMAHYLLCKSPMEGVACGSCKSCQLIEAGSHPDFYDVAPEEQGKVIKVDQIRQLTDFVAKTAQQGGRKLVLVTPAEAMNISAANSLLKCLEEPAGDTVLILVTLELSRLIPTIRSRCSKLVMPLPDKSASLEWLEEMGVENTQQLLSEAGMAPLLAMDWWQSNYFKQRQDMCGMLATLSEGGLSVGAVVQNWSPLAPFEVVNTLLSWLDGLLRDRVKPSISDNASTWESLIQATKFVPAQLLYRYRDALCQRKAQLLSNNNLNPSLVVEELLLDWKAMVKLSRRGANSAFTR